MLSLSSSCLTRRNGVSTGPTVGPHFTLCWGKVTAFEVGLPLYFTVLFPYPQPSKKCILSLHCDRLVLDLIH